MKSSIRILTISLALALLLVVPATFMDTATAAEGDVVTLSQDQVEWVKPDAMTREAGYYSPGPDDKAADNVTRGTNDVHFYLRDDGLTTTVTASTTLKGYRFGDKAYSVVDDVLFSEKEPTEPAAVVEPDYNDTQWNHVTKLDGTITVDDNYTKALVSYTTYLTASAKYLTDKEAFDAAKSAIYEYKFGSTWQTYDKVNANRRYTGGATQPLLSVTKATVVRKNGDRISVAAAFPTGADTGTFTVVGAPASDGGVIEVEFTYAIVDVYQATAPTTDDVTSTSAIDESSLDYTSGNRRAKVTSNSDSIGEWIEISEVAAIGSDNPAAQSGYYLGAVTISDNADDSGTGDAAHKASDDAATTTSRVWVQDGDTLTVTIYSGNGDTSSSVIGTASVSIDDTDPEISGVMPEDGKLLNSSNEVISVAFTISDSGSGFDTNSRDANIKSLTVKNFTTGTSKFDRTGCTESSSFTFPLVTSSNINVVYAPGIATWDDKCDVNVADNESHENSQNNHGLPFELEITAVDTAGNEATKSVELRLDGVKPTIVNGEIQAGKGWDASDQKAVTQRDSILVKFNESLNPATVDADDFNVVGFQVISAEVVGVNADDDPIDQTNQNRNEYVALTLSEDLEPNSKPQVNIAGAVEDDAGNIQTSTTRYSSANTLAPNVTVPAFTALLAKGGEQAISYSADEALRAIFSGGDKGTRVSVSGSGSGRGVMGDRESVSISLSTTMQASGTFKQKDISKTGIYGVMVQAVDRDGNDTNKGATKVTEEDVSDDVSALVAGGGSITITPSKWPIADHDVDGTLTDTFSLMVNGADVVETVTGIDWEMGEVMLTVTAPIPANASVKVTYYYVDAAQVIQVDTKAPSASFTPADGESTDDTTPFIQINFDDDEYAGDTHKTVTLTAATLKATDGTPTDIMDSISTTDNIEFIYVATEELALGEYEITVSATDEASNELKEESSTFTVKARAKTTIALQPSWNLISLRGAPVSLDINDIITDPSIETVSSYDPSLASPWTVWIRGADGMLESSPAGRTRINPGHALWVRSNTGQDLEVDIPGLSRDDVAALPPSISLVQGWNLVAAASVDPSVKTLDPDVYFAGLNWVRVYEFNALTGRLEGAQPSTDADDDDNDEFMDVGKGYWVYLNEAGTVIP